MNGEVESQSSKGSLLAFAHYLCNVQTNTLLHPTFMTCIS